MFEGCYSALARDYINEADKMKQYIRDLGDSDIEYQRRSMLQEMRRQLQQTGKFLFNRGRF